MNFIKNLIRKIRGFISNIFTRKQTAPTIATASAVAVQDVEFHETVEPAMAAQVAEVAEAPAEAVAQDDLAAQMETICQLAANRNYQTDEAVEAYYAGDKAALNRIERAMRNKSYKAPGKGKKAKQERKARTGNLAAA